MTQMREREKESSERERESRVHRWGIGSDPDEFFRRFPGDFLFFPVVTSGAVVGRRQFAVKFLQPALTHSPVATRAAAAGMGAIQTRGMAAACSRKPINLYRLPSTISPSRKIFYRRADVYLRSGLYLYFRVRIDSRPGY